MPSTRKRRLSAEVTKKIDHGALRGSLQEDGVFDDDALAGVEALSDQR